MSSAGQEGNRKVNASVNKPVSAKKKPSVDKSRLKKTSKAVVGKYFSLDAVKDLRAISLSLEQIAERVGRVSRHAVHKWKCGRSKPKIEEREAIAKEFGIQVDRWLSPEERSSLQSYLAKFEAETTGKTRRTSRKLYKKYLRELGKIPGDKVSVDQ